MSGALIAFLGPSLSHAEAKKLVRCEVRPPARQGDVWRALSERPRAIALIDGVFESQPSVWHHELRAALASGVSLYGAASMGALRAAELAPLGMIGVGKIFQFFAQGLLRDDSEVALLHASAEHDFRPLTVPLINVRHAAFLAVRAKVLTPARAKDLIATAGSIHYQERRWPKILAALKWPAEARARLNAWLPRGARDLKAADARECLKRAAKAPLPLAPTSVTFSSFARRQRLIDTGEDILVTLEQSLDAGALTARGTQRLLLAGWARQLGMVPGPDQVSGWLAKLPTTATAEDERLRLAEDCALEELIIQHAQAALPDGPSALEALVAEARVRGRWTR